MLGASEAFEEDKANPETEEAFEELSDAQKQELLVLQACPAELLKAASETCDHIPEKDLRFDCKYDVCVTGDPNVALDSVAMEVLEIKEAKGTVVFEGDGRCLDYADRLFTTFKTHAGQSTAEKCQEILRSLATTKGVRGAELGPSKECLIAVDHNIDPKADLDVGWEVSNEPTGDGEGIVSSTSLTGIEGWRCWKLIQ